MIVKAFFSHVIFSLWSQTGSSRRTIALYGGDSAASAFIPGTARLEGGRAGRMKVGRVWTWQTPAGIGGQPREDSPSLGELRLFTRALLVRYRRLRPASASPNVRGRSGINRSPHNCVTLYQVNRFRSELVAHTDARIEGICLVGADCSIEGSVRGRIGLKEAVSQTVLHLRPHHACVEIDVPCKAPIDHQRNRIQRSA